MNLHRNPKEFKEAVLVVADRWAVSPAIVEKDYYVTLFLSILVKKVPEIIFKGGTSLSKCYKIIHRFSEDIDLTLPNENQTQGGKRNLKREILSVIEETGLRLKNEPDILSRRDYNRYEIEYPSTFEGVGIKQNLLLETVFLVRTYPEEIKNASSMIFDFWKENGFEDAIKEFEMDPFEIHVQTMERTFVDKVFALCDYAISRKTRGCSRHIYDLYCLLQEVSLDEKIKGLVQEVREDRKKHARCFSAQDDCDVPELLEWILREGIYVSDYKNITEKVLFDGTDYETASTAIQKIIDSRVFEQERFS